MADNPLGAVMAHMDAINSLDGGSVAASQHFPFTHLWPDGRCEVAQSGDDLRIPAKSVLGAEWDHSTVEETKEITHGDDAVSFHVVFARRREDDSVIGTYEAIWVATRIDGDWGIQFRHGAIQLI